MSAQPESPAPVTVVVIDDSVTQRRFIRTAVENEPHLDIVGEGRTGRDAVAMVEALHPDVVLMDLHLPVMNGIEAIERIMSARPTPIVVYSSFVHGVDRANAASAYAAGAVDVMSKPALGDAGGLEEYAALLCQGLRVASRARVIRHPRSRLGGSDSALTTLRLRPAAEQTNGLTVVPPPVEPAPTAIGFDQLEGRRTDILAIGASTGGPPALAAVLEDLPAMTTTSIVVVQHMAEGFMEGLVAWLDDVCPLPVVLGMHGRRLAPGTVTIAPSGRNMVVHDRLRITTHAPDPGQHHLPGIDVTFTSLARSYGSAAVGVLLTGMGRDGALGLKQMRDAGALTIGQDEATSAVYGMPAAAVRADAVEVQLSLPEISRAVRQLLEPTTLDEQPVGGTMNRVFLSDQEFAAVAHLLRETAGLSFDESRRDSLGFSIAERMQATDSEDVPSYLRMLSGPTGVDERQALIDEVTVPETHFFRNPPQVRALRQYVLPELLRQAGSSRRLRVWSAGCSTGEEAYTIAILIRELLPSTAGWDIKVLATDVSKRALAAASAGHYGERSFVMTDPLDLSRWFVLDATNGSWVVRDEVREMVEFRHHNMVSEAPPEEATAVDLILCRNVTIYFDRETTRSLMTRLHQRLRDGGYLFLGHAETLWQISADFTLVPLGDAFVYRRIDAVVEGEQRRRGVLPDRRTEDEFRPTRVNRRSIDRERRDRTAVADGAVPRAALPTEAPPASVPAGPDPLDAVRTAVAEGRYDEAIDLVDEVIAATPLRADAHYLQGLVFSTTGRDADALVVLRKALYLDPQHGFAHFLLGGALERLGEPLAASRSYRAAAGTLGQRRNDAVATELGGRSVAELAALCTQLADRVEPTAGQPGGPA